MVGIVVVSHSARLAEGVVELARQMGGEELALEAAGGMEDGTLGTDVERVGAAIERAMSPDGVLVLMDLGSALMSAEMAVELLESDSRVQLSEAPVVEGTVAAAVAARAGASLEEVRAEAAGAVRMKEAQLGVEPQTDAAPARGDAAAASVDSLEARIPVLNEIGLHARPAALVAELAGRFDVQLRVAKPGGAPVSARSLSSLMTLAARQGDELVATASGPQAQQALAALEELAEGGFGEGVATVRRGATARRAPSAPEPIATQPAPETILRGVGASDGIAVGPARHLAAPAAAPEEWPGQGPELERRRLAEARAAARRAIEADRDRLATRSGPAEAAIFAAHLALLEDEATVDGAHARIEHGASAESAWYAASAETAASLRALDDDLLRERATDVEDVGRRVVAALSRHDPQTVAGDDGVLVVAELTPAQAAAVDPTLVRGIAAARGTATAHAAILARALAIPAVVGLGSAVLAILDGTALLLDGGAGTVVVAPREEAVRAARQERARLTERRAAARRTAHEPAMTVDGVAVEVSANLGGAGGAGLAVQQGADGVGLLRTEFLFLGRQEIPSEDEQAETMAQIALELDGRPLIVRTLDAGADKPLPALSMAPEQNPFLGRRGVRLSLEHRELFAAQLRAILRVSAEHPLKVMFPMVATLLEVEAAQTEVQRARQLTGVDAPLEVGIMIEVPAAALQAAQLAAVADFFSIGTNDLTQYTMAAERGNERVADLLIGPQPAVLRLIRETVSGAQAHERWVGVCGELAGDPPSALLLVGLGVRELSMSPPLIPEVKQALRSVTLAAAGEAATAALKAGDAAEARRCGSALLS